MNREERLEDIRLTLIAALQGWQADMWSALPGIIQSVNFTEQTCVVQLAIQMQVTDQKTGVQSWVSVRPLLDCPLFFPHGGNCSITFPVAPEDECLVVFSSRCIDAWFETGQVSQQALFRMHDLSDGFALAGFRSKPRVISGISSSKLQIRSNDGSNVIELDPAAGKIVMKAAASITLLAPEINLDGPVLAQDSVVIEGPAVADGGMSVNGGTVTDTLQVGTHNFATHIHSGVSTGTHNSGPPV